MVASCRNISQDGGELVFNHVSIHPMQLTASNLPTVMNASLQLQLFLWSSLIAGDELAHLQSPLAWSSELLGSTRVCWQEALLAEGGMHCCEVELWPGSSTAADDCIVAVGRVGIIISLHTSIDDALQLGLATPYSSSVDCVSCQVPGNSPPGASCPIHLRVSLGRVVLDTHGVDGVMAVLKLGPAQEITAYATKDATRAGTAPSEQEALFSAAVVSAEPFWQLDALSAKALSGPRAQQLFLQVWRKDELVGLSRIALPSLDASLSHALIAGRHAKLSQGEVQVLSAASGLSIGSVQVLLQVGTALSLAQALRLPVEDIQAPIGSNAVQIDSHERVPQATQLSTESAWDRFFALAAFRISLLEVPLEIMTSPTTGDPLSMTMEMSLQAVPGLLVGRINGMTEPEATVLAVAAAYAADPDARHQSMVTLWTAVCRDRRVMPLQHLVQYIGNIKACLLAGVDKLAGEIGTSLCTLVRDLHDLGPSVSLRRGELSNLLRGRGLGVQAGVLEDLFRALSRSGEAGPDVEIPVLPLARLLERRRCAVRELAEGAGASEAAAAAAAARHAPRARPDDHERKPRAPDAAAVAVSRWARASSARAEAPDSATAAMAAAPLHMGAHHAVPAMLVELPAGGQVDDHANGHAATRLWAKAFEVTFASGTDPAKAFAAIDRDADGLTSLEDFVALLRELGLPLSDGEVTAAGRSAARGERITVGQFAEQYRLWLAICTSSTAGDPGGTLPLAGVAAETAQPGTLPSPTAEGPVPPQTSLGPTPKRSACMDLPVYVLFASLDIEGRARVPVDAFRNFTMSCLGFTFEAALEAAAVCDPAGRGSVAYRDFRRFVEELDGQTTSQWTEEELHGLAHFRATVRRCVEISRPDGPTGQASIEAVVSEALTKRGRRLSLCADVATLEELLTDLGLPAQVAAAFLHWQVGIGLAAHTSRQQGQESMAPPTFQAWLDLLRRSQVLLQMHLEGLYGACMVSSVDLRTVLEPVLRREDQTLTMEELAAALEAADVDLSAVDLSDVLLALDGCGSGRVPASELAAGHAAFQARFGALLGDLARRLGTGSGLSPDKLLARAAKSAC